jgi:hypothetical protein
MEYMLSADRCDLAGIGDVFEDGEILVVKRWHTSRLGTALTKTNRTICTSEFCGIFL